MLRIHKADMNLREQFMQTPQALVLPHWPALMAARTFRSVKTHRDQEEN